MEAETYLRAARQLSHAIRNRAAECESLRRLPEETFESYQRSGLLRALQPRQWGGFELSPLTFFEAVVEVAGACPSSAWFLSVVGIHNWQLGLFPEEAQRDVWGKETNVLSARRTRRPARSSVWTGAFGSRVAGRSRAAATIAGGCSSAASLRATARSRTCGRSCCRDPIIGSSTTGTSRDWPARAARTSSSRAHSSPSTARIGSSTRTCSRTPARR